MRCPILPLLLGILCVSMLAFCLPARRVEAPGLERSAAAVLRLIRSDGGSGSCIPLSIEDAPGEGSGWLVRAVTAKHVIAQPQPQIEIGEDWILFSAPEREVTFSVQDRDGLEVASTARVLREHPDYDLAEVLFPVQERLPLVPLRDSELEFMEPLWSAGFGNCTFWVSQGLACGSGASTLAGTYRASCLVCPGASGGAVLDQQGRLAGVIIGWGQSMRTLEKYEAQCWFIPLRGVRW